MKQKKIHSFLIKLAVTALAVLMFIPSIGASAVSEKTDEIGYETYTYWYGFSGNTRKPVYSKPMYEVKSVLTSADLACTDTSSIADVHTGKYGLTYVLDGGSSRVLILDEDYKVSKIISVVIDEQDNYYYFKKARGIFVDDNNCIYIADTDNARVIKCDGDGKLIRLYTLPDSHLIPTGFSYQPVKVAVDNKGYVYILSNGSYYGAILYSPEDVFLGFYGANSVAATITQALTTLFNRLFMNNEKRSEMVSSLPFTFTDLWVDDEGFVYTATGSTRKIDQTGQIKRLNPGGGNILKKSDATNFADEGYATTKLTAANGRYQDLSGVAVDKYGFIHAIDTTYGRIFIYDSDCKMLTAFGGGIRTGSQDGTFVTPSAIAYNLGTEDVIITDSYDNTVTVFNITHFGTLVKSAQAKTIVGDYEEAMGEWTEVISQDRNCQLAYAGLAKAYYVKGQAAADEAQASEYLHTAIELAEQGYDRETYSLAYGSIRSEIIRDHFTLIMILIVAVIAVVIFLLVYSTKRSVRLVKNEKVHIATTLITHPFDNFREMKEKNLVSLPICFIILILYYVFDVMETTMGGFAFTYFDPTSYNALLILAKTAGFVILWTVANWAVSTLLGGKGKVKEIFAVVSYSLIPALLGSIIYVVATNLLVPNEAAFLSILTVICTGYSILLITIGSMTVHDYSFIKFLGTAFLTLIGCAIVVFLLIAVGILCQQTWGFISTLYTEIIKLF